MSFPLICNIKTLFPPAKYSQAQLSQIFKTFCDNAFSTTTNATSSSKPSSSFPFTKAISSLFQNTRINHRHFMFPPNEIVSANNNHSKDFIAELNELAVNKFAPLSDECVNSTLNGVGINKKDVHTIFSYTPLHSSPAYSAKCLKLSELKKDAVHTPIHGLASSGGVALLSYPINYLPRTHLLLEHLTMIIYANQYLKGNPTHCALTLTAECGSRLWARGGSFDVALRKMILSSDVQIHKEDIYQQIVVASLLGDGLSSCVVVGANHPLYKQIKKEKNAPYIVDSYSHIVPETLSCLGSNLTESGSQVFMSRKLAEVAPVAMVDAVSALLERNNLTKNDILNHYSNESTSIVANIKFWLAHPGGPRILQTVQETLSMTEHDFRWSWGALAEVGNVSSASVLRAYELCMEENNSIQISF